MCINILSTWYPCVQVPTLEGQIFKHDSTHMIMKQNQIASLDMSLGKDHMQNKICKFSCMCSHLCMVEHEVYGALTMTYCWYKVHGTSHNNILVYHPNQNPKTASEGISKPHRGATSWLVLPFQQSCFAHTHWTMYKGNTPIFRVATMLTTWTKSNCTYW